MMSNQGFLQAKTPVSQGESGFRRTFGIVVKKLLVGGSYLDPTARTRTPVFRQLVQGDKCE